MEKSGWTGIAFVNVESAAGVVTLKAYDDNGLLIASETINLDPYEKVIGVAENIFGTSISDATYIRYSSTRQVVGFQLNGSTDGGMLDAMPGM